MNMIPKEHTSYRPATLDDVGWLTGVFLTSLRVPITEIRGYWNEAKEREQFMTQLRLADTRVILNDGTAAGFYTAWMADDHLFLGTLCIHPAFQNHGLGAAAMRSIAQETSLPIRFSVLKSNRAARRFYERLGCRFESSTVNHDHYIWRAPTQGL